MAFKQQDPVKSLASAFEVTCCLAGRVVALALTVLIPALSPISPYLQAGCVILGGALAVLWLRHRTELPDWFFGSLVWAAAGNVAFFAVQFLQKILEIWFDFTPYQLLIDLVSSACPMLLGAIGALIHKDNNIEEDHNNG